MNRKTNKDWTDALRESVEGAELTPSAGGWEKLSADLRPRKSAWWPYAVSAAACAAVCAVFLFRNPAPAGSRIDVLPSQPLTEAVAEVVVPEAPVASAEAVVTEVPVAEALAEPEATPLRHLRAVPAPPVAEAPVEALAEAELSPAEPEINAADAVPAAAPLEQEAAQAAEAAPADRTVVADQAASQPATRPQRPAPHTESFGFDDPWPAPAPAKQRRRVTVTVSAGGAFGSGSSHNYVAKSYATKADDSVMDLSEVIQHDSPVQASLGVQLPLTDRLGVGSGLEYLNLTSSIGPASQQLQWIGVPLVFDYRAADWGQSKLFLNAGARGEKCLSASLLGMQYNEPFQLAANLGAEYKISLFGPVALSLMPEFSYYFTQTVLPTYRSNRPLTFNLCAGLSVQL